jgi:hypothetical protein
VAAFILVGLFLIASCMPPSRPGLVEEGDAQRKLAEYQLARNVVARNQLCFERLLLDLRAMMERNDPVEAEQEFIKRWGIQKFDPSTSFDDALDACTGRPTLKELGMSIHETTITFLERKRKEWEAAQQAETTSRWLFW